MEINELECALEAVLFASGESVSENKLCAVLGIERAALRQLASSLADYYDYNRRGIKLLHLDDRYQLCSRSEYSEQVRNVLETRRVQSLSPSALEVLSVIAYKQPVTRAVVESIRGVDSSYTISSLADKGLVVTVGRLDVPGRPSLYGTTEAFLRAFGLETLSQLPSIAGFDEVDAGQLSIDIPPQAENYAGVADESDTAPQRDGQETPV